MLKKIKYILIGCLVISASLGWFNYINTRKSLDASLQTQEQLILEKNNFKVGAEKNKTELNLLINQLKFDNQTLAKEIQRLNKVIKARPIIIVQGESTSESISKLECLKGKKVTQKLHLILSQTPQNNVIATGTQQCLIDNEPINNPTLIEQKTLKLAISKELIPTNDNSYKYELGILFGINNNREKVVSLLGTRHLFDLPLLHNPLNIIFMLQTTDRLTISGHIGLSLGFK